MVEGWGQEQYVDHEWAGRSTPAYRPIMFAHVHLQTNASDSMRVNGGLAARI